jgi:hypothetical protein
MISKRKDTYDLSQALQASDAPWAAVSWMCFR